MFIRKYLIVNLILTLGFSSSLQDVFDNAESLHGFDKYLILEEGETYTGGIGIYEGRIFIEGNGAIIDFEYGGGIWVYADQYNPAHLEIEYANIIDGAYYGVSYAGTATGRIENCNLINNDFGLKFFDTVQVEVKNCNLIGCNTYGLGIYGTTATVDINYCNFWDNAEGDTQENCPN